MADTATRYMGIALKNPVVVGACSLSGNIENIQRIEALGAGALVIKSLFEEQILHEAEELDEVLAEGGESFAESLSYFPKLEHGGPREHLMWIEKARAAVQMPLIGSLNASRPGRWAEYASRMADTGVNGIELNVYAVEADVTRSSRDVEEQLFRTVDAVRSVTDLPLAVKLGPYYSSTGHVVRTLEQHGVNAVILFNRFLQPDISVRDMNVRSRMTLSHRESQRLPLRWTALLFGKVGVDLVGSSGIQEAEDVVKFLLAGATAIQAVGVFYRDGLTRIADLVKGLEAWMTEKGYASLADMRGQLSRKDFTGDPRAFERAQYFDFLLSHAE